MKRLKNIYEQIYSIQNLELADKKARKRKSGQPSIQDFDNNRTANLLALQLMLKNKTYKTSEYKKFFVYEPKSREVYRLPYFPDRIAHHAVMNHLQTMFTNCFTANTYSCIKGRGIYAATYDVRRALQDIPGTRYCLKLDIKKFYLNVDHTILKDLLRKKIGDKNLLWLLDEIIDSAPGLPIGNYLSQYFANFYLAYFDHWIKETMQVKYYFRYADDLVVLSGNKEQLHKLLSQIRQYLASELKLEIKGNYQIFPVQSRGIDFVGYVKRHTHTRLRKGIKKNAARAIIKSRNPQVIASYNGWFKHGNCKQLQKKLKIIL